MLSPSFRLQGPLTCAIGRWVDEAMPTYRTNDEARFHLRCNPAPLYQWVRKFQSCRSPLQLSPGWLSRITHYNESLESHKEKVNLPESARKVLQTWRIRYSKGWGCISWCWSSFSWVVCRFALRQFSRKDLYINFLFISVTIRRIVRKSYQTIHQRPFSSSSLLPESQQSIYQRSGRISKKSKCLPTYCPVIGYGRGHWIKLLR